MKEHSMVKGKANEAVRSDGSTLHVDFENFTDTLFCARNAGAIIDHQARARILDDFAYQGRRCAHVAAFGPDQEARVRLVRAWDAPKAVGDCVVEFVFRPVVDGSVELVDWPVLSCQTPGGAPGAFELKYLADPVFGAEGGLEQTDWEQPRPVALDLYANGDASQGTYRIDLVEHGGRRDGVIEGLPQGAWVRFVLHRHDRVVDLYAGEPERETFIGTFQDLLPGGEVFAINLGNAGYPDARGSGHWDAVRVGKVLKRGAKVAAAEPAIRDVGAEAPEPPKVLKVGRERQLFIDDWCVDRVCNIRRVFHRPVKHAGNPILVPDRPWEGNATFVFGAVERQKSGQFRLWYYAHDPQPGNHKRSRTCLAVSDDGIRWEKPPVGVHEFGGSFDNNIVIDTKGVGSMIVDSDDPRPDFRYKLQLRYSGTEGWSSPDGVHWTRRGVILPQSLDATSVHYDPVRRKYVASVKMGYHDRRYRGYAESDDFLNWTDTYRMMDVDERDAFGDQVYAMQIMRYESLYLGLCKIYHVEMGDTCDVHLAVSHNGRHWERPYRPLVGPQFASKDRGGIDTSDAHRQPFIPTGPAGSWEFGNNDAASTPPIRVGDELWFYYSGRPVDHSGRPPEGVTWDGPLGAVGLARLRVDGFVSAEADRSGGQIVTRPLRLEGQQLFLNANASDGELRVEVLDSRGRVVEPFTADNCRAVKKDAVRLRCGWKGARDLSALAGKAVRLRFQLRNAALYAFWTE